ncbi:hypothetical protein BSLG_002194 [Batrachochytrium salamandrivorans]|nr:hypothetical protein BSLG_002194 [Batrachochytrium salamandrivorans]
MVGPQRPTYSGGRGDFGTSRGGATRGGGRGSFRGRDYGGGSGGSERGSFARRGTSYNPGGGGTRGGRGGRGGGGPYGNYSYSHGGGDGGSDGGSSDYSRGNHYSKEMTNTGHGGTMGSDSYGQSGQYQQHGQSSWQQSQQHIPHQSYQPQSSSYQHPQMSDQQYKPDARQNAGPSIIDRPGEATCRTLFVRNVSYNASEADVRHAFEPFGEVKLVFDLIAKRGIVFVTFVRDYVGSVVLCLFKALVAVLVYISVVFMFDLRAAERARIAMQDAEFIGRKIDVHYSVPKQEDMSKEHCTPDKYQGTLKLRLQDSREDLKQQDVYEFMSRFGEVKVVRCDADGQLLVEFWDMRAADRALDHLDGNSLFKGGRLEAKPVWDSTNTNDRELKRSHYGDKRRTDTERDHAGTYNSEYDGHGGRDSHSSGRGRGGGRYEDRGQHQDDGGNSSHRIGYNPSYGSNDVSSGRHTGSSLLDSLASSAGGGSTSGHTPPFHQSGPSQQPLTQLLQQRPQSSGPQSGLPVGGAMPMQQNMGGPQNAMGLLRLLGQVQQVQSRQQQVPLQQQQQQQQLVQPPQPTALPAQLGTPGAANQLAQLLALIEQVSVYLPKCCIAYS